MNAGTFGSNVILGKQPPPGKRFYCDDSHPLESYTANSK